jgi:hypothetical protein
MYVPKRSPVRLWARRRTAAEGSSAAEQNVENEVQWAGLFEDALQLHSRLSLPQNNKM